MPVWPVRSLICLDCRTLTATTQCPVNTSHRVVSLRDSDGRRRLVDIVWAHRVPRYSPAAKTNWSGWDVFAIFEIGWFALAVIAGALLWLLTVGIVNMFRRRKELAEAQGARRPGPNLRLHTGQVGYVVANDEQVAVGSELRLKDTLMLRDGATTGFDVQLDSGARVQVPPGLCAFDLTDAPEMRDVDGYLAEVDPQRVHTDPDPFPYDDARRVTLAPGDRVEVLCRLEPRAGGLAGYRDSTTTLFVPRGFVRLRKLP